MARTNRLEFSLLAGLVVLLTWSGIRPHDYPTWALEVAPAVIGVGICLGTFRTYRLTRLTYCLIAFHAAILIVGGHYTYAEVPIGNWAQEQWGLSRNHYDRVAHFIQGFVPAIIAREILIRSSPAKRGGWLFYFVISICIAISAVYELVEWGVAEVAEAGSTAFLGTQGDIWDTQKDMALCSVGAVVSLLSLGRWHDHQLATLASTGQAAAS